MFVRLNYYVITKWLFITFITFSFVGVEPFSNGKIIVDLSEKGGGSTLRQLMFISFWLASFVCYLKIGKFDDIRKVKLVGILLLWCAASTFWSVEPGISLRRSVLLIINAITLFMLISILDKKDIWIQLRNLLAILILLSVISIPIIPGAVHSFNGFSDENLAGSWKGVFTHKNQAGVVCAISCFVFFYFFQITKQKRWGILFFISLLFLFFTNSKTSLGLTVFCLFFSYTSSKFWSLRGRYIFFTFILALMIITPFIYDILVNRFMFIISDPMAFTGRATIWAMIVGSINDFFYLGAGYGAVWSVGENSVIANYASGWVDWVYHLSQGHNGYLDVLLSIGCVGFVIAFITIVIYPLMLVIKLCQDRNLYMLLMMILSFFVFHNSLETDWLAGDKGRWLILLLCVYYCHMKLSTITLQRNEYKYKG